LVGIWLPFFSDVESHKVLTSRAKYALRATLVLAELKSANGWTSASALAEAADVPRKFLEAILTQLRDHGLLESRRGPAGGHRLAAQPSEVSAADVIRAVDGPLAMTPCASVTAFRACDDCADLATCRMRALMRWARGWRICCMTMRRSPPSSAPAWAACGTPRALPAWVRRALSR
jgi:Rrf2 family protein